MPLVPSWEKSYS